MSSIQMSLNGLKLKSYLIIKYYLIRLSNQTNYLIFRFYFVIFEFQLLNS